MFSLTISFGPTNVMWTLMFRNKEQGELAFAALKRPEFNGTLVDDFGQEIFLGFGGIHGVIFEDMELSKLAHIERALHQARMQAKGAEAAESDPVLRANRFRQGPAVLTPGMNGPMR